MVYGGVYGQCKFHWYEDFEKNMDKFVTWGWSNDKNYSNDFEARKKLQRSKKEIMFNYASKGRYFSTILDSRFKGPQMLEYHQECMKMVGLLNNNIKVTIYI